MNFVHLLATDRLRSVMNDSTGVQRAYAAYGLASIQGGPVSAFCGEYRDALAGCYHLGNGYRQFNPAIMRFHGPDGWSPFGEGGINAYVYCTGDPINKSDPTGHFGWLPVVTQAASSISTALGAINRRAAAVVEQRIQRFAGLPVAHAPARAEAADTLFGYAAGLMGAGANIARSLIDAPAAIAGTVVGQLVWIGAAGSAGVAGGTNLNAYPVFRSWTKTARANGMNRVGVAFEGAGQMLLPPFVRRIAARWLVRTADRVVNSITYLYGGPGSSLARGYVPGQGEALTSMMVVRRNGEVEVTGR
ncbi:RHS repeat-associated core domain-containing protein [Pseudomonas kurunegalensis]|uniref:RHS repeat-associated core domain-containing protein n=1 Tax=Pseudomonas kurunegalensis TaxID=485880 RepID=UPI002570B174|nr:RHS repeat-associated core domain-containing protein [Pseudomonas kurunegalensis]WJD63008.1 RHS repeat-associated core domain-containing protein [Pseudomonas kurunegalensis]